MPLRPAYFLERLVGAFLFDVEQLIERPYRPLILFDHQCAERNGFIAVRMGDRTARLVVHAFDFAVLGSRSRR